MNNPPFIAAIAGGLPSPSTTMRVPELNIAVVLDRVARDPSVPIERLERVLDLVKEQRLDEAHGRYAVTMAAAQHEMSAISRDMTNEQTRSKYASLAQVDAAIRPIYTKMGLSITFDTEEAKRENWIIVVAQVSLDFYTREFRLPLPVDGLGPKGSPVMTKTHAMMSAITSARRTLLKMIFNLAETDDDGNAAGRVTEEGLTPEQHGKLVELITRGGRTVEAFCKYAHIEQLEELPQSRFEAACNYVKGLKPKNKDDGAGGTAEGNGQ